jgi:hypothetical protein
MMGDPAYEPTDAWEPNVDRLSSSSIIEIAPVTAQT